MSTLEGKDTLQQAIHAFAARPLRAAGMGLLDALGYRSDLTLPVGDAATFRELLDPNGRLDEERAKTKEWLGVEFLRQVTADHISISDQNAIPFQREYLPTEMQSYVFVAVDLSEPEYTRKDLSNITRAVNRMFDMPAMLFFRYGDRLTLAVIDRRPSKRDSGKDVTEKITLIKDVRCEDPHRAHVDILHDLSLEALYQRYRFHTFEGLHQAWKRALSSQELNRSFYREIADWYFSALEFRQVVLPRTIQAAAGEQERALFFIRLLTRLIFCWFLREKGLVPQDLFNPRAAGELLHDVSPMSGTYYKAILQNLFFATLNQEQDRRGWRLKYEGSRDGNYGVTNLWRYRDLLRAPERLEELLRDAVPFVNGGLFDCLDDTEVNPEIRRDDFSDNKKNGLCIPNILFFGERPDVDLSDVYGDERRQHDRVRGLIDILGHYKFTVEENTPLEEEIALDPELLGNVFENLLAAYNPDTRVTARKQLGAFYTPRRIVEYLVDESVRGYLAERVPSAADADLRALFEELEAPSSLSGEQKEALIAAISRVKILDPACGSGAFPMGALHRLVDLLGKLDPNNETWKRDRLAEAERYRETLRQANAPREELEQCEARMEDIRRSFDIRFHALDFARKLHLVEHSIFGVDILPLAAQIAKLRFFISLLVDQKVDHSAPNLGVLPLPNLEMKIVVADSLGTLRKPAGQRSFADWEVDALREELEHVRHDYFTARTHARKTRCRQRDADLRAEIAARLAQNGWDREVAATLAAWDPYDPNDVAPFFDPEWMFGFRRRVGQGGEVGAGWFDIIIGNPPYVRVQTLAQHDPAQVARYQRQYASARKGNFDLYVLFIEAGLSFLEQDGRLAYILPHKFFNTKYGEPIRRIISHERQLQHVVHFGDQQVFPGATNYVCLLFLCKAGVASIRFVRVDDLQAWLETLRGTERLFASESITEQEWVFPVGREADVFERLRSFPIKLGDIAELFVGLQTSADTVFVFKNAAIEARNLTAVHSAQLDMTVEIESSLLKPVIRSGEISRFWGHPSALVLFPYRSTPTGYRLLSEGDLRREFPAAWRYLLENRDVLENRERGRFRESGWWQLYPKNLDMWDQSKIMIPYMISRLSGFFDINGSYFVNVTTGGFGLTTHRSNVNLPFLTGLINSRVLDWYLKKVSTTFHGGYFAANKQFLVQLPVAETSPQKRNLVIQLSEHLSFLHSSLDESGHAGDSRDRLMLSLWEQVLDAIVYELYFPDELHAHGLHLFDLVEEVGLPEATTPDAERLPYLRELFERIYDPGHPLRAALFALGSLETVQVIEGRA